jgi:mannose-6-phosphate isomerase-like protein (cupin superfamily)
MQQQLLAGFLILSLAGCSAVRSPQGDLSARSSQYIIQPHEGDRIAFCNTPGLSVNIKVDSVRTGSTTLAMGTAELVDSNFGVHRDEDEVVYFIQGEGRAVVGADTLPFQPGTTMYVPRGVRHGFVNMGEKPVRFVWFITPRGLEQRFRTGGVPQGTACPAPSRD